MNRFDLKPSTMVTIHTRGTVGSRRELQPPVPRARMVGRGIPDRRCHRRHGGVPSESQLRIGYAYDMTTSKIRHYSSGSHEIMLGIDLGKDPIRIKSPRYF